MLDILLIGATGYTGRLIAKYIHSHRQASSFTWGVTGRSQAKLQALAADIGLAVDIPTFIVDTNDHAQLVKAVRTARIVINAVGPFILYGTPVVRACAENRVHYVDVTAEIHWVRKVVQEFHATALNSGTIIIPSAGVSSLPSDLSAFVPSQTLLQYAASKDHHLDIDQSISAWDIDTNISGGTLESLFTLLTDSEQLDIGLEDYIISSYVGKPSPPRQLQYNLRLPGGIEKVGGMYIWELVNRAVVQRTYGLLELDVQEGSSSKAKRTSYGPHFTYQEFHATKTRLFGVGLTLLWLLFMKISLLSWLAKHLSRWAGQEASDEELRSGKFELTITNITTSVPTTQYPEPVQVKTVIHGTTSCYALTAVSVVESALAILLDYDTLPTVGKRGGVLTPMAGLGNVLVDRLNKSGLYRIESEIVAPEIK